MALEFVSGFIVSSLLQDLVDRIKASAADTITLAYSTDVEEELKNLEASYLRALTILHGVDGWDLITSKPHRDWVADVRRACYEIEDFTEHLKLEILKKMGDANFMSSYWTRWGVSRRLHDLQTNLDRLSSKSDQFIRSSNKHPVSKSEQVTAPDEKSFRRKRDKEVIIQSLLHDPTTSRSIIIEGMFGIGKTVLAQVVKNDPRIESHFNHKLWVPVSGNFNLQKALNSMILDLQLDRTQKLGSRLSPPFPEQFSVRMFQSLCKGRRVLLVLDDLWSFVNPQDWEDFQSILLDPSSLFSVMITTRNPKVANTVASVTTFPTVTHFLQRMSDEDCQSLILQKAVNSPPKRKYCQMEMTTLEIAEKFCKGLPLMANLIGHHLSSRTEVNRWPIMLSHQLWNLPEFKEQVFSAFRLNYSDLSIFLKNCFPYFSLFPENYNFKKEKLVRLWLAEGFIKPEVGSGVQYWEYPGLEELGSRHFDEVLSQSILQIYHPFNQLEQQIYRMHDFIHQYAQFVGSDMYVCLDEQLVAPQYRNVRHLSFLCPSIPPPIWKDIEKCKGLRTILSLREHTNIGQVSYTLFLKLQSLRVLDLSGTDISDLPESVGKLKHLHLLDVSKTDIQELPESISDLNRLQVLKLDHCPLLLHLPKDLKNLIHLLHLEVDIKGLSSMPPEIGNLRNLRTLPAFIVGRKEGYRVSELKDMKYIQGSICLTNLENVKDDVEAMEAMLCSKPFLKRLELEWNKHSTDKSLAEKIMTSLEPHDNLEELQVSGYDGTHFPSWVSNRECKFSSIHLLRCQRCSILPALGRLQHLKALHIEEFHRVKCIDHRFFGSDFEGFPSLESLKLYDMMSLERWDRLQANQMLWLRDLVIGDCPNLVALPSLNLLISLVTLEISCCPMLQALPEEGLPLSLKTLIVVKCDLLKRRCLFEEGADWEKIKAIPKVVIDFKQISKPA